MAIIKFQCPDGQQIPCQDCIDKCRMHVRCVPPAIPPYIFKYQRKPKPERLSVTEALNPIFYNWMRLTQDAIVEPQDHIYAMIGTLSHVQHEKGGAFMKGTDVERYMEDDLNTGTTDMIHYDNLKNEYSIRDIKTKRCKAFPYYLDHERKKNSFTGDYFNIVPSIQSGKHEKLTPECDFSLQLNRYRIMAEKLKNIKIKSLWIDMVFIDWSKTTSPMEFGLKQQCYSIPIAIQDDDYIIDYFNWKHEEVQYILKHGPEKPCYDEEMFTEFGKEGARCKNYCQYKHVCPDYWKEKGITHKYL